MAEPTAIWPGSHDAFLAARNYKEAVAAAAKECAEDTKGQTCYICTESLHWKTKEGLVRMCACRGTAGFAHVSCLAEQAKILFAEAEENNLDLKVKDERWERWYTCSMCEQQYHGVVKCALGWACWKTYVGRPETDPPRRMAMTELGNGLVSADCFEDALVVREAELSIERRLGADEEDMLVIQTNLAMLYGELGNMEKALSMERDVYTGHSKLRGKEDSYTRSAANNYAASLLTLERFEEAKSFLRKSITVSQRVCGGGDQYTLMMRKAYAKALYQDPAATPDDLREAVTTLEDAEPIARRVLGGAHPITGGFEDHLRKSRAALRARDRGDVESIREGVEAMPPGDA